MTDQVTEELVYWGLADPPVEVVERETDGRREPDADRRESDEVREVVEPPRQ